MNEQYAALTAAVLDSDDPIVRYKARRYLDGADPTSATMRRMQDEIADSPIARGLLADLDTSNPNDRQGMSTIYLTFRYLAEIDYPPGDDQLVPYRDHVYRWLRRLEHEYDGPLFIRGKHRVHGSFHANAIYASVALGLADDDTDELCTNLLRYQWPGGGWNCNKKPATKGPTVVHTAFGLRGLAKYRSRRPSDELTQAIDDAAQVLLERRVYLKRSDGQPLRDVYTKLSYPYPRLYDFMAGLHVLTRAGYVTDERCANALDLLESKFVPDEGWAMERKLFNHSAGKDGFTHAPWDEAKLGRANLLLTIDALEILRTAGRWQSPAMADPPDGRGARLVIRPESPDDHGAIRQLVAAAFESDVEAQLVDRIRASPEYVPEMALVAEVGGDIVGHVMVSHAVIRNDDGDRRICMLSPLAVHPEHQGSGIGRSLVRASLSVAEARGEPMVILEGSPAYYGRLGFEHSSRYGIEIHLPEWAPSEAAQVMRLSSFDPDDPALRGTVVYPAAFDGLD